MKRYLARTGLLILLAITLSATSAWSTPSNQFLYPGPHVVGNELSGEPDGSGSGRNQTCIEGRPSSDLGALARLAQCPRGRPAAAERPIDG